MTKTTTELYDLYLKERQTEKYTQFNYGQIPLREFSAMPLKEQYHYAGLDMKTETEYKHTPGPWYISTRGSHVVTSNDPMEQSVICSLHGDYRTDEIAGNAELIVMAPSLLQERDTLKAELQNVRDSLKGREDQIGVLRGELTSLRNKENKAKNDIDTLREANKELIEALSRALNDFKTSHWTDETYNVIESALLKHRKEE